MADKLDTVSMDVPLFIRMLELAREDIKSDAELHDVVTKVLAASKTKDVLTMEDYPMFVSKQSTALARLTELSKLSRTKVTAKEAQDIPPDMLMQALSSGLTTAAGPLKLVPTRITGKYQAKVFVGQQNKGMSVFKLLKSLDFSSIRLDNQKLTTGVRMETNGKMTYVSYASLSGVLIVTSNADSLDI
jgi:hypothetical protein